MAKRLLVIPSSIAIIATAAVLAFSSVAASAASIAFTVGPWAYSCGHTDFNNPVTRSDTPDSNGCSADDVAGTATAAFAASKLSLSKECLEIAAATCTKDDLSSGATIGGILHLTGFSYDVDGYCGAGAPRLNVVTGDNKVHFFGCSANNEGGHVTIDLSAAGDGNNAGGVAATDSIKSINFVFDEAGSTVISNIAIAGTPVAAATASASATATAAATSTAATRTLALTGGAVGLQIVFFAVGGLLLLLGLSVFSIRRRAN
jgi:hypothetical protein